MFFCCFNSLNNTCSTLFISCWLLKSNDRMGPSPQGSSGPQQPLQTFQGQEQMYNSFKGWSWVCITSLGKAVDKSSDKHKFSTDATGLPRACKIAHFHRGCKRVCGTDLANSLETMHQMTVKAWHAYSSWPATNPLWSSTYTARQSPSIPPSHL